MCQGLNRLRLELFSKIEIFPSYCRSLILTIINGMTTVVSTSAKNSLWLPQNISFHFKAEVLYLLSFINAGRSPKVETIAV